MLFLKLQGQGFFIFWITSVSWKITPLYFVSSNLIYFWQKKPHWSEICGLLSGWVKIYQIPYVIFGIKSSFFLQTLHHYSVLWDITLLCFLSYFLYGLDKRIRSKCKFSDFQLLASKLTKFLLFFKPHVSFLEYLYHLLVPWHIILLTSSSWNIKWFCQKEPIIV